MEPDNQPTITRRPGEPMTQENFWGPLEQIAPLAMHNFQEWVDRFKEESQWERMFSGTYIKFPTWVHGVGKEAAGVGARHPKLHELPVAIQVGITYQFIEEQIDAYLTICGTLGNMGLQEAMIDQIVEQFRALHHAEAAGDKAMQDRYNSEPMDFASGDQIDI